jgi:hypothetical protein
MISAQIATATPQLAQAQMGSPVILKILYTTVLNPVIQVSTSPAEVEFTAYLKVTNYQLADGDLICGDKYPPVQAIVTNIGPDYYSAKCTITFDQNATSSLSTIRMTGKQEMVGNQSKFKLIPANASQQYTAKSKDSFGQIVETTLFGYEIFSQYNYNFVTAAIAVNPPTTFKYPSFPLESNAHVIFDVRKSLARDLQVKTDLKRKSMSITCQKNPLLNTHPVPSRNVTRTALVLKNWRVIYGSVDEYKFNNYLADDYQGQKLNLICSYFVGMKDKVFGDQILTYVESKPKLISFPKR